jgi:hypothetical protein
VESSCECGYEPSGSLNAGKLSSSYTIGGLSSSAQFHRVSYTDYCGSRPISLKSPPMFLFRPPLWAQQPIERLRGFQVNGK